jgi:hypothetical protein
MPRTKSVMFLLILCSAPIAAAAMDQGQFNNIPDNIRNWFKTAKAPNGSLCCDLVDGHRTEYDMRNNHYWVPIEGVWVEVPAETVIQNAHNPTGEAVVWYSMANRYFGDDDYYHALGRGPGWRRAPEIRCFAPAGQI